MNLRDTLFTVPSKQWLSIGKELLTSLPSTFTLDAWKSERYDAFIRVLAAFQDTSKQAKLLELLSDTLGKNHKLTLTTEELLNGCNSSEIQLHQPVNESFESPTHSLASRKYTNRKGERTCWCFLVFSIAVAILVALLVAVIIALLYNSSVKESVTRVAGGDTVQIDAKRKFWYGKFHVAQCEKVGDYSHVSDLKIVETSQLIKRRWSQNIVRRMEEFAGSRNVGVLSNITYLLSGAELYYEICLASDAAAGNTAVIYVFDNTDHYTSYLVGESDEIISVASFQVSIGRDNNSVCTQISFTTDHPGYYYISGETPVALTYFMNATLQSGFYNSSDYSKACSVSEFTDCDLTIPGGLFSNEEYTLLAAVRQSAVSDPPFTHICVLATRSLHVIAVAIAAGCISFLGVIFLSVVLAVGVFRCLCQVYRRGGYSEL